MEQQNKQTWFFSEIKQLTLPEAALILSLFNVFLRCLLVEKRKSWQCWYLSLPLLWWKLLTFLSLTDQQIKDLSAGCPIKWGWYAHWVSPSLVRPALAFIREVMVTYAEVHCIAFIITLIKDALLSNVCWCEWNKQANL